MTRDPPGLPARRAALRMLDAVLRRGDTLDAAMIPACRGLGEQAGPDKALARALAAESLRWLVDLDALIDSAMRQPLAADVKARAVLRLMLAGWLRLGTPPHAAIATGLPLLAGGARRLAHGVFSTLVRRGVCLPEVPRLPAPVEERWAHGGLGGRMEAVAAALATPPPPDVTLRDASQTALWAGRLDGLSWMPGHVRLARGRAVEDYAGFAEGAWWVQDFAASLPARLLGRADEHGPARVLDVCAAPGGKTLQLAATGWHVTALDASARRLDLLRANLLRAGLTADVIIADALQWAPPAEPFQAILLDAPCTATGTCRRHPDVLHRINGRHIAEMAELQQALLARVAGWLAPGGRLIYAVCSLEDAEGEGVAAAFDGGGTLLPEAIQAAELPAGLTPTEEGWLRTDPGMMAGMDGFFIARWRRKA